MYFVIHTIGLVMSSLDVSFQVLLSLITETGKATPSKEIGMV